MIDTLSNSAALWSSVIEIGPSLVGMRAAPKPDDGKAEAQVGKSQHTKLQRRSYMIAVPDRNDNI